MGMKNEPESFRLPGLSEAVALIDGLFQEDSERLIGLH